MTLLRDALTPAGRAYLLDQPLGRLATIGPDGAPHVVPVGFRLLVDEGAVDIVGADLSASQKWRNVLRDGRAALVVDDLASIEPWSPRGIQLRGTARAVTDGGRESIRLTPTRVVAWGLDTHPYTRTSYDLARTDPTAEADGR